MNLLNPVNTKINKLKKKTNPFAYPWRLVSFNTTRLIRVTDIASTAKKPVFIPKIKKIIDATSPLLVAWEIDEKSIFSGDAKRGTLKIAFARNITNKEIETFLTLFCNLGNLTKIALPKIIPCNNPIPNAVKIPTIEKIGFWKISTRNSINAIVWLILKIQY